MINILHFYKTYYPDSFGGVEQVIYHLCEEGVSYNINSTVHVLSENATNNIEKFHHHSVFKSSSLFEMSSTPFSISAIGAFRKLANKADIIHYHFPYPFMDILHFLVKINKPTVVSYHSDIVKQKLLLKLYRPVMYRFLNSVDAIVATSPNYLDTSTVLQKFKNKVSVIPIGISDESTRETKAVVYQKWSNYFPKPFFLFVGALRYYKGLHNLLDALVGTTIPVVILGDGPMIDSLRDQVEKNRIENITFIGKQSDQDKSALLKLCYGVIFPSHLRTEAFGITLLEGAMYGKPLITCEIGTGTSFVNIHEVTGLVVKPNDIDELRYAMQLLIDSPELAALYGKNARERFEKNFTVELMMSKYAKLYNSLLSK